MAVQLSTVAPAATAEPTIVEAIEVARPGGSHRLAVLDIAGVLTLARESERGLYPGGATTAATADDKRSREHGTEHYWKRLCPVADIADAVAGGLLGV